MIVGPGGVPLGASLCPRDDLGRAMASVSESGIDGKFDVGILAYAVTLALPPRAGAGRGPSCPLLCQRDDPGVAGANVGTSV